MTMLPLFASRLRRLKRTNSGVAVIEFAIILPILILIILGVIEFGIYFLKYQTASRAAAIVAGSIQANPSDATIQTLALNSGMAFANFAVSPNYICATSYTTQAAASAGLCTSGQWKTTMPTGGTAGTPYYVAVVAFIKQSAFTPGFTSLPDIKVPAVFEVGATTGSGILAWVTLGVGTLFNNGSGDVLLTNFPSGPDQFCQSKGYTLAPGGCKGVEPSGEIYQGTIVSNTSLGSWFLACMVGNTTWYTDHNTQILCSK